MVRALDLDELASRRVEPGIAPGLVDRDRLIQVLVRTARERVRMPGEERPGAGQKWIAHRARVTQTTVSNIENIERSIASPKRRVGREEYLKVLTWGLELRQPRLDALLWLYDGAVLGDDEIRAYVRGYDSGTAPERYTARDLRGVVLDMVQDVIDNHIGGSGARTAPVRIFANNPRGLLELNCALCDVERLPGMVMTVTHFPCNMNPHPDHGSCEEECCRLPDAADIRDRTLAVAEERKLLYRRMLRDWGQRTVNSRDGLRAYVSEETPHQLSLAHRRRHAARMLRLLEAPDVYYEIGLADTLPPLEMEIKSTMRAAIGSPGDFRPTWGPAHILFSDEASVLGLYLTFERQWDALRPRDRDRRHVAAWLRALLGGDAA